MTIIVGYVPTKEGDAALERAVEECQLRKTKLVVINSERGGRSFTDEAAQAKDEGKAKVDARLKDTGVDYELRMVVRGNEPGEDLIEVAEELDADLIVIGLRRRTPVGKLILGSNAQRILLDAPCAVLAVKASS
ncbi:MULTISPECIES: universal stress protein [unclassified Janibacter]|uniref:universal stress protein n=1 Tax=unclassified Janibacter TaxID=2649294 RepID=UPI003D0145E5